MQRLTPLVLLLAAACGPSVVNCPPGYYIGDDGMCTEGTSDTAGGTVGGDDDDDDDAPLDGFDDDGDGWAESVGDCDDSDPTVHPDAEEAPDNGKDDDCDRSIDEVEQSLADRVLEPDTVASCTQAATWSAYQDLPKRYVAVTLIRVGSTTADDLPSLSQSEGAIEAANEVLASAGLELFVAAETVVYDSAYHDLDPSSFATLRNLYADDGTLHLFVTGSVVDIDDEDARGLAIAPGGDRNHGIAIGVAALTEDRALAHLVGHGLGLGHTHSGTANGLDPELVDGSNCTGSGDALCDTPADPGPSWAFDDGCAVDANACALVDCGTDADGAPYVPDIENAMSVYPDHCGVGSFTDDQAARMRCSIDADLPGVLLLEQPAIRADVELDGFAVDDDLAGPSEGDNDGSWELGETVEITVDLVNAGAEPAANVVAQLSDNQPLVSLVTSRQPVGNLPIGGRASVTFVAEVPLSCTTDFVATFTLDLSDDDGNQWSEDFDIPVACDAEIDIEALSAGIQSASLRPGLDADFEISVRNNSLVPLTGITADLYLSSNATLDPATDTFLCRLDVNDTLNAGASRSLTTPCAVPAGLGTGNWRMGFVVDPDDVLAETQENNNEAIAGSTTPVQTPPNLTIENLTYSPSTVSPGATLRVDYLRSNTGGSSANNFELAIYLSSDSTIDAGDDRFCLANITNSPAGDAVSTGIDCTLPPNTPLGDYYVGAVIDDGNDVAESDETDNEVVSATRVTVEPDVDLEILAVNLVDTSGAAGGLFDVELEMRNNGTVAATPFEIGVLFSTDGTVTAADTLACDVPTGAPLNGGVTLPVTLTNCAIPSLPGGDYTVGVWLDSNRTVAESNESNNIRADLNDDFTIQAPDLWVHDVNLPNGTSGSPGDPLWVEYTRENIGNVASGSFRLSVVFSTDATITTADTQVCFADLSSPAGDQVTGALNGCTVPNLPPGAYWAGVIIDSLDDVAEDDETNNIDAAAVPFSVL